MIAASARTSGTSRPNSSTRKRGVCSSLSSRARAVARADARLARRARAADAEYACFFAVVVVFLAVLDFAAVVFALVSRAGVFCVDLDCAANVADGKDTAVATTSAKDTAIFLKQVGFAIENLRGL